MNRNWPFQSTRTNEPDDVIFRRLPFAKFPEPSGEAQKGTHVLWRHLLKKETQPGCQP
jgi:hypothetical protein